MPDRNGFPRAEDDGAADHLSPQLELPPVLLPATDGRELCLSALPGLSVVVAYPWTGRLGQPNPPNWDDIKGAHGSTPELEGFRDAAYVFAELGARLFALSRQASTYQREMVERLRLPFPVLSDAEGRFTAALALPTFATGGEIYLKRLTLIVRDGVIEMVFYPVIEPARHASEVIAWLKQKAAQSPSASSSASSTE